VGEHPEVGHGERTTCYVIQRQAVLASSIRDVMRFSGNLCDGLAICVLDYGHDQHAVLQSNSNTYIDVIE